MNEAIERLTIKDLKYIRKLMNYGKFPIKELRLKCEDIRRKYNLSEPQSIQVMKYVMKIKI